MSDAEQFEHFINSPALAETIGPNAEKFRAKWRAMFTKAQSIKKMAGKTSWNWPAFLLGGIWMLYRRMYVLGVAWLVAVTALAVYLDYAGRNSSISLALYVLSGLYGNAWYFHHLYKKLGTGNAALGRAGVSWLSAVIGAIAFVAINAAVVFATPRGLTYISEQSSDEPEIEQAGSTSPQATQPHRNAGTGEGGLTGQFDYVDECCHGGIDITPAADAVHVHINTASKEASHLCDVEGDAPLPRMTGAGRGTILLDVPDTQCKVQLTIDRENAVVSSEGEECYQLCGSSGSFTGSYKRSRP